MTCIPPKALLYDFDAIRTCTHSHSHMWHVIRLLTNISGTLKYLACFTMREIICIRGAGVRY